MKETRAYTITTIALSILDIRIKAIGNYFNWQVQKYVYDGLCEDRQNVSPRNGARYS